MRTVKHTPVALSGSLSLQCRLQFARHCRPNWKQCNAEVGTPSSLSPRCRWPCIFSFKCCLCERKRTGLLADRWLHRAGSPRGFEVNLMGTTLSTNQLQQKCARWLFNFLGEESAPRPVMCEGAQHPMQNRLQMRALCGERRFSNTPLCGSVTRHHTELQTLIGASRILCLTPYFVHYFGPASRAPADGIPEVPDKVPASVTHYEDNHAIAGSNWKLYWSYQMQTVP